MKTPLINFKRLTISAALAITISFGLIGGQPSGTALAEGLPFSMEPPVQVLGPVFAAGSEQSPSDPEQPSETTAADPAQATQQTAPDSDVQAAGAIVNSLFGP